MKKALYLFALVVGVLGVTIAISIALKAPPAQEHLEGMLYVWNGPERSETFLKAWKVGFAGVGAGLFFGALGSIIDRLERLKA